LPSSPSIPFSFLLFTLFSLFLLSTPTFGQTFAIIGDYGSAGSDEEDVANLLKSWNPDFVITTGDNNYPDGAASTIDENIGQYYHEFIYPYLGSYGQGASSNKFFPSLGNHDWVTPDAQPYLDYFTLPYNERYYEFVWGDVHFFAIDSDSDDPDGAKHPSIQSQWLQSALAASTSQWKIVYFHQAAYSSGHHGNKVRMQWPFQEWGATVVIAGHDHTYERLLINGLPYFVNGLGGASRYAFENIIPESQVRYNDDYGAMLVSADSDSMNFKFINVSSELIDSYTIYSLGKQPDPDSLPEKLLIYGSYPNPFSSITRIQFYLPQSDYVTLRIFNLMGEEAETLISENLNAGFYNVFWDASLFPNGIYYFHLQAGIFVDTKKTVVIQSD
jgi:hypothetical protein